MPNIKLDKHASGKTKTTYKGQRLARLFFDSDTPLTNAQVKDHVRKFSKEYKKKGVSGIFSVSCLYPIGWRSGELFHIGDEPEVYDPEQWYTGNDIEFNETCSRFAIYVLGATKPEGGDDLYNDCLYKCIRQAFGSEDNLPIPINRPWKLKKLLGLGRSDKIPLDKLSEVESLIPKCSISVYGDYQYISSKKAPMNIKLKLQNEHFTLMNNDNRTKTANTRLHPVKKENVYSYQKAPIKVYNGKEKEISEDELREMIKNRDNIMIRKESDKTLQETRDKYVDLADDILFLTNDRINLYKYPTLAIASMDIFRYMSKMLKEPEPISPIESSIIEKAFAGGLTYAEKGYKGFGVTYDVNSMYPSLLIDQYVQFPMMEGEPITLNDEQFEECVNKKHFKYGFYRCKISKHMLFKQNTSNVYTHHDLLLATELGLTIDLIQDDQYNFYYYERDKLVKSNKIFTEYVNFFYKLKQQYKPAKELLNCLWGALMQKDHHELYIKNDFEFTIDDDVQITSIKPSSKDESMRIQYSRPESIFKTDYARIGPFLTAHARLKLVRSIKPYVQNIVKVHTDSFTLNKDIPVSIKIGQELGQFKIEHKGDIEIIHVNKVIKN